MDEEKNPSYNNSALVIQNLYLNMKISDIISFSLWKHMPNSL